MAVLISVLMAGGCRTHEFPRVQASRQPAAAAQGHPTPSVSVDLDSPWPDTTEARVVELSKNNWNTHVVYHYPSALDVRPRDKRVWTRVRHAGEHVAAPLDAKELAMVNILIRYGITDLKIHSVTTADSLQLVITVSTEVPPEDTVSVPIASGVFENVPTDEQAATFVKVAEIRTDQPGCWTVRHMQYEDVPRRVLSATLFWHGTDDPLPATGATH